MDWGWRMSTGGSWIMCVRCPRSPAAAAKAFLRGYDDAYGARGDEWDWIARLWCYERRVKRCGRGRSSLISAMKADCGSRARR